MLKKLLQIGALALPMFLVACSGSSSTGTGTAADGSETTTSASYAGTYSGTSTGVNSGPTTMVIASSNSIKGTFTINNRTDDNGVPTIYESTLEGSVSSTGKVTVNAFLEGALVMIFTGDISSSGALSGTYIEAAHPNDPSKHGSFSLQGPANGTTTTTTITGSGKGCTGSYVGGFTAPSHEIRISMRNESLRRRGIAVTGDDAVDNKNAGGGGVDGGIYMEGSYAFETDANCNVIKGEALIFGHPFPITGQVQQDRTFVLSYLGPIVGKIEADNSISGQFQHGGGEEYVYGDLNGKFTPNGKI